MNIKDVSDVIYSNVNDRERMEAMNELYYEMADYVRDTNPSLYRDYCDRAEDILYQMDESEAEMIVRNMRPYGEYWNRSTIDEYVSSQGENPCIDYYLAMNMAYNDYKNTAQMMGVDTVEFYFNIARDFLNDPDAKRHKIEKYFRED